MHRGSAAPAGRSGPARPGHGLIRHLIPNRDSGFGRATAVELASASRPARTAVERVVDLLKPLLIARAGVSPPYDGLRKTPQALHLARVALESARPGTTEIVVFDEAPLQALVVSAPTTSYRMTEKVFGPLLALAPAERDMLLATLQAYFRTGGSVADAGKLLFCHPNTVRNHLRRIEKHSGKSLDDPAQSAELYVALAAFTRLPEQLQSDRPG